VSVLLGTDLDGVGQISEGPPVIALASAHCAFDLYWNVSRTVLALTALGGPSVVRERGCGKRVSKGLRTLARNVLLAFAFLRP
jgi:hypothetical protein